MRISDGVQTCALPISFPTICRSGQRRPALELIQRWKSGESWHRGLLLLSMATSAFISPTVGRRALFMMRWRGIIDISRLCGEEVGYAALPPILGPTVARASCRGGVGPIV